MSHRRPHTPWVRRRRSRWRAGRVAAGVAVTAGLSLAALAPPAAATDGSVGIAGAIDAAVSTIHAVLGLTSTRPSPVTKGTSSTAVHLTVTGAASPPPAAGDGRTTSGTANRGDTLPAVAPALSGALASAGDGGATAAARGAVASAGDGGATAGAGGAVASAASGGSGAATVQPSTGAATPPAAGVGDPAPVAGQSGEAPGGAGSTTTKISTGNGTETITNESGPGLSAQIVTYQGSGSFSSSSSVSASG